MNKKLKLIIMLIILIFVIPYLGIRMPVKRIEKDIDTTQGSKSLVNEDSKEIYVQESPDIPGWIVVGEDGVLFNNDTQDYEKIFAVGNMPESINNDLLRNTFVLKGKYLGKKKYGNLVAGCFDVEEWGTLGKIKRGENNNLSSSSLTILDYISAEKIGTFKIEDLSDVD